MVLGCLYELLDAVCDPRLWHTPPCEIAVGSGMTTTSSPSRYVVRPTCSGNFTVAPAGPGSTASRGLAPWSDSGTHSGWMLRFLTTVHSG